MFVQYSFVQRRSPAVVTEARSIEMTQAMVLSAGVAFMAITSILFLLGSN